MRVISIVRDQSNPGDVSRKIVSLDEFAAGESGVQYDDNCVAAFEDFTLNFEDLNFWDSEKDMHKCRVSDIKNKIEALLMRMKPPREWTQEDEDSITIPSWMFGHKKHEGFFVRAPDKNLPGDEREHILAFHLKNILELISDYDDCYARICY